MRREIKDDLYRYVGKNCENFLIQLRYIIFTPGFRYIYFFRQASLANNKFLKLFYHWCLRWCMIKYAIQIPYSTKIGRGFRIVHFGHIVINPATIIGENFNISQGALIGNAQGKHKGTPIIGNNVCLNANAVIIGGVTIGDNVLFAPGAFCNFDVPSNSIVIGNPGKIIPKERPTDKYIVYPLKNE